MGHITTKGYTDLAKRLNKSPQGAYESKALYKILKELFSEKEAEYASILPMNLFTVDDASKIWKKNKRESKKILNSLAKKGALLDLHNGKTHVYFLAPPMVGFFEFSLMRTEGKFNKKLLAKLYSEYLDKDDNYVKNNISIDPLFYRVFIQEKSLDPETVMLDYERAKKVIETADCITLGRCFCRHKKEHEGKKCKFPQNTCMSFNLAAKSLVKQKIAKKISKKKALETLDRCVKLGLIQLGDNVQNNVNWMCNCCGCCCEAIDFYKRFKEGMNLTSNFISSKNKNKCINCKICVEKCPVKAIKITKRKGVYSPKIDKNICIGCGVCASNCPQKVFSMKRKEKLTTVPKDNFELMVLEAIDKGKLQNYLLEKNDFLTNNILRRLMEIILKLPPTKFALANKQVQSKFLNMLSKTKYYKNFHKIAHKKGEKIDYTHNELEKIKEQ